MEALCEEPRTLLSAGSPVHTRAFQKGLVMSSGSASSGIEPGNLHPNLVNYGHNENIAHYYRTGQPD